MIDVLSKREIEVLDVVKHGYSKEEIGAALFIAPCTVKRHTENIRRKLSARNTANAIYLATKAGLISLLLMISVSMFGQKLILTGNVSGSYDGADTICFINATGTNLDVCADVIIVEDSDLIGVQMYTGDCTFTCDSSLIPGIATPDDYTIGDAEWIADGYDAVIQDSADFYTQDFLNLAQSFGLYVLNDVIPFACRTDTLYVTGVTITPPGGVDRPSGTRQFDIEFYAEAGGRNNTAVMTWIRTEENIPMSFTIYTDVLFPMIDGDTIYMTKEQYEGHNK